MSKEHKFNEKIIDALSNISIKFDELGFVPTTLNDKNYEYFVDWFKDEVKTIKDESSKQEKTISDLEAKLAESEKELNRYAELFGMKDKDFYVVEKTEYEKMKQGAKDIVMQLKQQLAEKEKEIKNLVLAHFENDANKPVLTTTEIINQDKISFAVEQLEKAKEKILSYEEIYYQFLENGAKIPVFCVENFRVRQNIDNQIKQLKEGK